MNEIKNIRHPEKVNKPDKISPSKPPWLKVKAPLGDLFLKTKGLLDDLNITTVCEEAACPNIGSCWEKKTRNNDDYGRYLYQSMFFL